MRRNSNVRYGASDSTNTTPADNTESGGAGSRISLVVGSETTGSATSAAASGTSAPRGHNVGAGTSGITTTDSSSSSSRGGGGPAGGVSSDSTAAVGDGAATRGDSGTQTPSPADVTPIPAKEHTKKRTRTQE